MRPSCLSGTLALFFVVVGSGSAQLKGGYLEGRISDASGDAVQARVVMYERHVVEGNEVLFTRCATATRDEGKYECSNLPAGQYLVAVWPLATKGKGAVGPFFSPGATALAGAEPVSVTLGSSAWADVRTNSQAGVKIEGTLTPLAPEAAFSLLAADDDGLTIDVQKRVSYEGKTGSFRIENVQPGHYILRASWLVDGAEHLSSLAIDVGSTAIENLRMQAIPNVVIAGKIGSEGGSPVSRVVLRRKDGLIPVLTAEVQRGMFLFPVVPSGEYSLSAPGSGSYIESLAIGSKVFDGDTFLTVGQPLTELQVNLRRPAMFLHGTVGEEESTGTDIVALSERTGAIYHVRSDRAHRFDIEDLAPGDYEVFAWPVSRNTPYRSRAFLAKNKSNASEVSLSSSSATVDLALSSIK